MKKGLISFRTYFGHGQVDVALSRATSPRSLKVLIELDGSNHHNIITNIVYSVLFKSVEQEEVSY